MNPHESARRSEKSHKLAVAIHAAGVVAEDAAACKLGSDFWAKAASYAECEPPHSQETIDEVVGKLRFMERMEGKVNA